MQASHLNPCESFRNIDARVHPTPIKSGPINHQLNPIKSDGTLSLYFPSDSDAQWGSATTDLVQALSFSR